MALAISKPRGGGMFKINDYIFYSTTGVCRIVDIRAATFDGLEGQKCYVVRPIKDSSSIIYIPVDNDEMLGKMRSVLTKEDICNLIHDMPNETSIEFCDERDHSKEYYSKIGSCDSRELVRIIKTIYLEKIRKKGKGKGKGLNQTENKIMFLAEKLLYEEFAFVLGIEPQQVIPFIRERIPPENLAEPLIQQLMEVAP
jgi:CarD family transcriptional regulator